MYDQAEAAEFYNDLNEQDEADHYHGHNAPAPYDFNAARERMNQARREVLAMEAQQADELAADFFATAAGEDDYFVSHEWARLLPNQRAAAILPLDQMQGVEWTGRGRRAVAHVTLKGGRVESYGRMDYQDYIERRIERSGQMWHDGRGGFIHGSRPLVTKLSPEAAREWEAAARERMESGRRAHSPITGRFKSQR